MQKVMHIYAALLVFGLPWKDARCVYQARGRHIPQNVVWPIMIHDCCLRVMNNTLTLFTQLGAVARSKL